MVSFISLHLTLQKCLLFMEIWTSCWKCSKFFFPADCVTDWEKKHLFHVFIRLNIQHHIPIIDLQVIHFIVTRYSGQVEIYFGFFKCVVTVFVVSSESSMIVSKLWTISKPARPRSSQQQTQLQGDWTFVESRELSFSPVRSFGRWYFLLRTATNWNELVQYAVLADFQSHTMYTVRKFTTQLFGEYFSVYI